MYWVTHALTIRNTSVYNCMYWVTPRVSAGECYNNNNNSMASPVNLNKTVITGGRRLPREVIQVNVSSTQNNAHFLDGGVQGSHL